MRFMFLLIIVIVSNVAFAQKTSDVQSVKQADEILNDLIAKNNVAEAEKFYAEDFILTTSSGKRKIKQDILHEISSPDLIMEINRTEEVEVRIVGTTAVLTGMLHQKGSYKGQQFDAWLRVTDTWVSTVDGWKILAGHAGVFTKT
jgi:ketosteroid isomerase-like protein